MKSKREKSSACFPLSLHTFKEKKVGGGETGVVNNSSLFYHQKLYLSANKQQKRPDKSSHFSSLPPLVGVLMRRKVFAEENQKKNPCSKGPTTWSSALGAEKGKGCHPG